MGMGMGVALVGTEPLPCAPVVPDSETVLKIGANQEIFLGFIAVVDTKAEHAVASLAEILGTPGRKRRLLLGCRLIVSHSGGFT